MCECYLTKNFGLKDTHVHVHVVKSSGKNGSLSYAVSVDKSCRCKEMRAASRFGTIIVCIFQALICNHAILRLCTSLTVQRCKILTVSSSF